ncbi:MAG TPA: hypothetical protein VGC65_00325 [Bacteroidia bacterium]|jgi:hypothetical protein
MRGKAGIEILIEINKRGIEGYYIFEFSDTQLNPLLRHRSIEIKQLGNYSVAVITETGKQLLDHCNKIEELKEKKIAALVKMVNAIKTIEDSANIMIQLSKINQANTAAH